MAAPGATRPNIVWVNCDQLRWDAVGYAGNPLIHTPHIDRLAARGVWFENAYCASPVCSPARASWFTGLYPHAHRQFINCTAEADPERFLAAEVPTIGDLLKPYGYACGNAGVWHLGTDERPQHGFDDFWACFSYVYDKSFPGPLLRLPGAPGPLQSLRARRGGGVPLRQGDADGACSPTRASSAAPGTVDRALEFLQHDHERPYLLLVGSRIRILP